MSRRRKESPPGFATRSPNNTHFTPMYDDQLDSPAFIALGAVAVRVYLILRQEYKGRYTGNNVTCPYDTFVKKGVSRNSISKAIRTLEALGFIICERGGLGHQATTYHFSDKWSEIRTNAEAEARLKELKDTMMEEERRSKLAKERLSEQINGP